MVNHKNQDTFSAIIIAVMRVCTRYRAVSIALLFTLFFSCEEPEPYFNKEANPPEVKPLILDDLIEGQHVTGTLIIEFIPETPISQIDMVSLSIDDQVQYGYGYPGPFVFQIDTKVWPEGEHTIMIGVHEKNQDLGLLNLAFIPSKMYTVTVYFDHQPPTPVVLQSVVWNNELNTPQLTWLKNNDLNFYAYIVQWEINGNYHDSGLIFDREVTTYANPEVNNGAIGFTGKFKVYTYNRDQSVMSNDITFTYPEIFPFSSDPATNAKRPIESIDGDELYTLNNDGVKAFSLTSNTLLRSHDMLYKQPTGFALSKDGTKLYVIAGISPVITVLDASTFEVLKTADPVGFSGYFTNDVICGRPDRLYISTGLTPGLKIMDASTLELVGEFPVRGIMDISSDNNTLFVANTDINHAWVYSIDVTTDTPAKLQQQSASDVVRDIQLSADDQTLFVIHDYDYRFDNQTSGNKFVDYWNASTLISYNKLDIPYQPFSMWLDEGAIYIPYGNRNLNYREPGGILKYSLSSGSLLKEWKFVEAPYACMIGQGNLYAFGLKTWIVPHSGL